MDDFFGVPLLHFFEQFEGFEFLADFFVGFIEYFAIEMVVLFVFVDGDFLFEFVGEHVEEAVADLCLCDEGRDVVYFEFSAGQFVVHLLHVLLQFFGHLFTFLQVGDFFFVLVQYFDVFL